VFLIFKNFQSQRTFSSSNHRVFIHANLLFIAGTSMIFISFYTPKRWILCNNGFVVSAKHLQLVLAVVFVDAQHNDRLNSTIKKRLLLF